jgi:hypothetical protein
MNGVVKTLEKFIGSNELVCLSKEIGRLGYVCAFNYALLKKWCWRLRVENNEYDLI